MIFVSVRLCLVVVVVHKITIRIYIFFVFIYVFNNRLMICIQNRHWQSIQIDLHHHSIYCFPVLLFKHNSGILSKKTVLISGHALKLTCSLRTQSGFRSCIRCRLRWLTNLSLSAKSKVDSSPLVIPPVLKCHPSLLAFPLTFD